MEIQATYTLGSNIVLPAYKVYSIPTSVAFPNTTTSSSSSTTTSSSSATASTTTSSSMSSSSASSQPALAVTSSLKLQELPSDCWAVGKNGAIALLQPNEWATMNNATPKTEELYCENLKGEYVTSELFIFEGEYFIWTSLSDASISIFHVNSRKHSLVKSLYGAVTAFAPLGDIAKRRAPLYCDDTSANKNQLIATTQTHVLCFGANGKIIAANENKGIIFRSIISAFGKIWGIDSSNNGKVHIISEDISNLKIEPLDSSHYGEIHSLEYHEETKEVWTMDQYGAICIWDQNTSRFLCRPLQTIETGIKNVKSLKAVSFVDRHSFIHSVMIGCLENQVVCWDAKSVVFLSNTEITEGIRCLGCFTSSNPDLKGENMRNVIWVISKQDNMCVNCRVIKRSTGYVQQDIGNERYVGRVFTDKKEVRQGYGELTTINEETKKSSLYIGNFQNNFKQGYGIEIDEEGNQYYGRWNKGLRDDNNAVIQYKNGIIYVGPVKGNEKKGGDAFLPNGVVTKIDKGITLLDSIQSYEMPEPYKVPKSSFLQRQALKPYTFKASEQFSEKWGFVSLTGGSQRTPLTLNEFSTELSEPLSLIGSWVSLFQKMWYHLHWNIGRYTWPTKENAAIALTKMLNDLASFSYKVFSTLPIKYEIATKDMSNMKRILLECLSTHFHDTLIKCFTVVYQVPITAFHSKLETLKQVSLRQFASKYLLIPPTTSSTSTEISTTLISTAIRPPKKVEELAYRLPVLKIKEIVNSTNINSKLRALVSSAAGITECINNYYDTYKSVKRPSELGADDLQPLQSYVVVQANVDNLLAHLAFTKHFSDNSIESNEMGHKISMLEATCTFVESLYLDVKEENGCLIPFQEIKNSVLQEIKDFEEESKKKKEFLKSAWLAEVFMKIASFISANHLNDSTKKILEMLISPEDYSNSNWLNSEQSLEMFEKVLKLVKIKISSAPFPLLEQKKIIKVAVKKEEEKINKCEECQTANATQYCLICNAYLCEKCTPIVHSSYTTKKHQIVRVEKEKENEKDKDVETRKPFLLQFLMVFPPHVYVKIAKLIEAFEKKSIKPKKKSH